MQLRMPLRHLGALALLVAGTAVANGCGTDAVDVDGCRQIQEARCHQGPACGITFTSPNFTSGSDVDACVRYYDDACLHGLAVGDPGGPAISACVTAIQSDSLAKDACSTVKAPETDTAACGWLISASTTDAGTDGSV